MCQKVDDDYRIKDQNYGNTMQIVSTAASCIQAIGSLVGMGVSISNHFGCKIGCKVVSGATAAIITSATI